MAGHKSVKVSDMSIAQTINGLTRKIPAWPLYILAPLWPAWMLWQGLNGGLGVDPVKVLEQEMGSLALKVLVFGLLITPLRNATGISLIKFRRATGLIGFFFVFLHLTVWLVLDVQIMSEVLTDIVKRPFVTIGMAAFVMMIPLALTSNNASVRRLGPMWRTLQKLTYPALVLGGLHYVILVKGWQLEPLVWMAIVLALLALRLPRLRRLRLV
mgnify:CR=1 FL=1